MTIVVCGCGAIGSNLIVQLSKQYPTVNLIGIDFDKVEARNIRTQAFFREHVGMPKVQAIRGILSRFSEKVLFTGINKRIDSYKDVLSIIDAAVPSENDVIVVDCFDNSASRAMLTGTLGTIPCLHMGFSPQYTAEIIWDEQYTVPGDVDPAAGDICSMDDAVSFIHFVVNFGVLNISQMFTAGKQQSYLITNKTKIIKM